MSGILRNKKQSEAEHEQEEFDRKQVLKNTERNALLGEEGRRIRDQLRGRASSASESDEQPDGERKKKVFPKTKFPGSKPPNLENVEFNEDEIQDWDSHRGQTQKILEPNTPYMGTAADTEYYDEDPVPDDLDLGKTA